MTDLRKLLDHFHRSSLDNKRRFLRLCTQNQRRDRTSLFADFSPGVRVNLAFPSHRLCVLWDFWDGFCCQRRFAEAEQLGLDVLSQAEEQGLCKQQAEALALLAHSQYLQNKRCLAEENLRHALQLAISLWGRTDPYVLGLMIELEGWLREWGREDEADRLKAEIDEVVGRDEIDEELDGY